MNKYYYEDPDEKKLEELQRLPRFLTWDAYDVFLESHLYQRDCGDYVLWVAKPCKYPTYDIKKSVVLEWLESVVFDMLTPLHPRSKK